MAVAQPPQKSYALFVFGFVLLIIVDFLWTLSSVLVQKLLDEYYNKPIIITYCSTSVFALYVPVFFLSNWLRSFFYSFRIKRALREKYENELSTLPTETTKLIKSHSGGSNTPSYQSNEDIDDKNSSTTLLQSNSGLKDSGSPYNDPSIPPYIPNDSIDSNNQYADINPYDIDARIARDMKYLEGVHADRDSQLFKDIRAYRVLDNERGWKVFKHNFMTALIVGPLWYTMNVTYNSALKMVSVSTNTIISTTAGFFVLLIGLVVFCAPVRKLHLLCVALAIFGSFLVIYLGSSDDDEDPDQPHTTFDKIIGPALCTLSAFLYGLYSVVIEYFTDKEKPLDEQKDSIAKQRKEAEQEEAELKRMAELEAQSLFAPTNHMNYDGKALPRSYSINAAGKSQSEMSNTPTISVSNHINHTTAEIDENFGMGSICKEQHIIERQRNDPNYVLSDEYDISLVDSDEEEDLPPEILPNNYDPNDPKLITGLLFGCVGLVNLVFAWPFIGLFHVTGFETLALPDSRALPLLIMNSCLGAALSDFLWANAVILTSPIIATLTIPGTIPIAMCYETFFLHKPLSVYSIIGSLFIVASSTVVTVQQYLEDKKYDKMTKQMLERRDDRLTREKQQRKQFRERQRQLKQLEYMVRAHHNDQSITTSEQPRPNE